MRRRQRLFVLTLTGLIAVASVAGCSPASAERSNAGDVARATTSAGGTLPPSSNKTAGGPVHLSDYTDNDGPLSTVVLDGAIGDFGKAERTKAKNGGGGELDLMLSHGSFRLDIADLEKKFISLNSLAVNTATCSATASVSGTVPITAGSGTGSYHGISGTFSLTMTLDEVYQPDVCNETSAYLAQSIVATGPGTVAFH